MLFKDHKKCPVKSSCNFCLLRSTILKANLKSGRQTVTPVEMECQNFKELSVEMMLEAIFVNAACSMKEFSAALYQEWKCSCCKNYMNGEEYLIYLEEDCGNKNIGNLLKKKYESVIEQHKIEERNLAGFHEENFNMTLNTNQKTCVFYHSLGLDVDLLELIPFGGKLWKCVGVITDSLDSYFRSEGDWYKLKENAVSKIYDTDQEVTNVVCAVYDEDIIKDDWKDENLCYSGNDLIKPE